MPRKRTLMISLDALQRKQQTIRLVVLASVPPHFLIGLSSCSALVL